MWSRVAKGLLIMAAVYYIARIAMFILSIGFDFILYSKKLQLNLWAVAWIFDVCIGFITLFTCMLYLKKRFLSFIMMLITAISFIICIPATGLTERLQTIYTPNLSTDYAISTNYIYSKNNQFWVHARLYKEVFPFVYKLTDSNSKEIDKIREQDTLQSFIDKNYEVNTTGTHIEIGKVKLSLK